MKGGGRVKITRGHVCSQLATVPTYNVQLNAACCACDVTSYHSIFTIESEDKHRS